MNDSRFRVTGAPERAPGHCFLCRTANAGENGPFIDTRLEHEHYRDAPNPEHDGNVYICRSCILELHAVITADDPPSEDTVTLAEQLEDARAAGYSAGVAFCLGEINDYVSSRVNLDDDGITSAVAELDNLFTHAEPEESDADGDGEPGNDEAKPKTAKSSDK